MRGGGLIMMHWWWFPLNTSLNILVKQCRVFPILGFFWVHAFNLIQKSCALYHFLLNAGNGPWLKEMQAPKCYFAVASCVCRDILPAAECSEQRLAQQRQGRTVEAKLLGLVIHSQAASSCPELQLIGTPASLSLTSAPANFLSVTIT